MEMSPTFKPVSTAMRWILRIAGVLVLIAGFQLLVFTEHTERYFAWTVIPSLTATFLGASYWASFFLVFDASRQQYWANARAGTISALIFTCLTTTVTLLNMDHFHAHSPEPITQLAYWAWMLVYWLVPPILIIILIFQLRKPGGDPARRAPLPRWLHITLGLQGSIMFIVGAALYLIPNSVLQFWPWQLTDFTAPAVGAWLIAMGVAAFCSLKENDFARVHGPMICYIFLGFLQLLVLARYATAKSSETGLPIVNWHQAPAWIYLLFLVSIFLVGLFSYLASKKKPSS